jgi:hypothetical protein
MTKEILVVKPLFWSEKFCNLHTGANQVLQVFTESEMVATIPYKTVNSNFKSPGIGTFGGFYTENPSMNWKEIWTEFVQMNQEVSFFEIIFPPEYFQPEVFEPQIKSCLDLFDPRCTIELNQHVILSGDAEIRLSRGNRKKYRQFQEAFGVVKRGKIEDLGSIVGVLQESRKNLGVELSMTYAQILESFTRLPEIYRCYLAEIDNEIVAAAIAVEISRESLYILYWGDKPGYWRKVSPVVAIFLHIYKEAQKEDFDFLDLGISSLDGQVNSGLARFKQNLGSVDSKKMKVLFQHPELRA